MWPGGSGRIHGGGAGEGGEQTAIAHSAHLPAPSSMGAGGVRGEGRFIRLCGVSPRLTRLVSKQFSILSPHS